MPDRSRLRLPICFPSRPLTNRYLLDVLPKLPELDLLHSAGSTSGSLIRIPPSDSVPLSARVRRILDTAPLRRLAGISQLGMVALVYPGATHNRLEHTLGVYQNALKFLAKFQNVPALRPWLDEEQLDAFVLAALLHDAGHWPFCHPTEDMQLESVNDHESRVEFIMRDVELLACINDDWRCHPEDILRLLTDTGEADGKPGSVFLASCLSGPVDIDKLDYLQRDSLHCGVPYGRNFDADRLISSLGVDPETQRLAVGEKGRTAAEMMVFARYVMFSEVYWHHTVRAATAMLQRSLFLLDNRWDLSSTFKLTDADWIALLRRTAEGSLAEPLVEGLFGPRRRLFKRVTEFSITTGSTVHQQIARKPYWWLVFLSESVAERIRDASQIAINAADILVDAPPVKLEVDINTTVLTGDGRSVKLGDISPVAAALAHQQFDNHVKRVRLFVRPELRDELRRSYSSCEAWEKLLTECIDASRERKTSP